MGHEIDVEEIIEPDEIIWENLAYTGSEQRIRQLFTALFALFFIGFSVVFTMFMLGFDRFTEQEIPTRDCQGSYDGPESKLEAYVDQLKSDRDENYTPKGLMTCYCMRNERPFEVWKIYGSDFVDA